MSSSLSGWHIKETALHLGLFRLPLIKFGAFLLCSNNSELWSFWIKLTYSRLNQRHSLSSAYFVFSVCGDPFLSSLLLCGLLSNSVAGLSIPAFARLNRLTLWKGKMINSALPHACQTTAGRMNSNPLAPRTHTPSQKEHWFKKKKNQKNIHYERIWDLQRSCENKMIVFPCLCCT